MLPPIAAAKQGLGSHLQQSRDRSAARSPAPERDCRPARVVRLRADAAAAQGAFLAHRQPQSKVADSPFAAAPVAEQAGVPSRTG